MRELRVLLELAKAGADLAPIKFTTKKLAQLTQSSQPTVARWLLTLERQGLIERALGARGQKIRLTRAGLASLLSLHRELDVLFRRPKAIELVGRVVTGIGEGSYYVGHEGYREQFKRELGFDPYPGTLDIKLEGDSLELRELLDRSPRKLIKGFSTPERTFGEVKCHWAKLRGRRVALVLPFRSPHKEIIEVIAPKNLRKTLGLKDGDEVKLEVML